MQVEYKWCDSIGTISSTSFTQPITFGRRHHYPPYSILCDYLWGLHPNEFFSPRLPSGSPKIVTFVVLKLWMFICSSNQTCLKHEREISYSLQKDLSKNVLRASIKDYLTPNIKGFVIVSQIPNLTLGPSFDHNWCILGLNE